MTPVLSEIERRILDYMVSYLRANTYQPSIREIGEEFGIRSTKTVSEHLQALADKGFVERDSSRSRGVRILGMDLNAQTLSVPCFRELPREVDGVRSEQPEYFLTLDRRMVSSKGSFMVRARGQKLAALGVLEGDYVLIEPALAEELEDGAVVVARVGSRPDYYRFEKGVAGVQLRPTWPPGEDALAVEADGHLELVGRVSAYYRRLTDHPHVASLIAH